MSFSRTGAASVFALLFCQAAMAAPETYMINLGPVARTETTRLVAIGRGTGDIRVDGNKMIINAKFDGMASPA